MLLNHNFIIPVIHRLSLPQSLSLSQFHSRPRSQSLSQPSPQPLDSSIAVQLGQTQQRFLCHHLPQKIGAPQQHYQHHPLNGIVHGIIALQTPGMNPETHGMNPEIRGTSPETRGMSPETRGMNPEILHLADNQILQMIRHLSAHKTEGEISQMKYVTPPRSYGH